eukprot:UN07148
MGVYGLVKIWVMNVIYRWVFWFIAVISSWGFIVLVCVCDSSLVVSAHQPCIQQIHFEHVVSNDGDS